jgi:hypothetical protein
VMAMEICMTVMRITSLKTILSRPIPCISIISNILTLGLFRNPGLVSNPLPWHPSLLHPLILDWLVQVQKHIPLQHYQHYQHYQHHSDSSDHSPEVQEKVSSSEKIGQVDSHSRGKTHSPT